MRKKIIIATRNRGKVADISEILKIFQFEILTLLDFPDALEIDETGSSFLENARLKAEKTFDHFNIPSIGDDSGLSVEQLNGRPGIFSARYAGSNATDDENNAKLIEELKDHPKPHIAKYICVASYFDGNNFIDTYGEVEGNIIDKPKGKNGFGYDPLFVPDDYSETMAELSLAEKNKISHRHKAFINLAEQLKKYEI